MDTNHQETLDNAAEEDDTALELDFKLHSSNNTKIITKHDNVFIWENPLHKSSPNLSIKNIPTPDEQADLDYDLQNNQHKHSEILNNTEKLEIIETPIALTNSCEEVTEGIKAPLILPPPNEFGGGNPFLMFLCITVLLQYRDHIISKAMDYNEVAMHFDKMVRKHNVNKVLNQARQMYARYLKQHTMAQQKIDA